MTKSIAITIGDLHRLIDPVLPCASTDSMLPVICAVQIKSQGRWLVATATDRFKIGIKRIAAEEGEWPEFEALLPVAGIKSIFTAFKALRGQNPTITLEQVDDFRLTASCEGGLAGDLARASCEIFLVMGEFPKVGHLVRKALEAEPAAQMIGFNWKYLSAFAGAGDSRDGTTLQMKFTGEREPALIVGEDFLGAIMPRKLTSGVDFAAGWDDVIGSDAKAEKAVA